MGTYLSVYGWRLRCKINDFSLVLHEVGNCKPKMEMAWSNRG